MKNSEIRTKVLNRRYKVLPLPNYGKQWRKNYLEKSEKITPVFNRNGFYLDRETKLTWVEIDGEAWIYLQENHFLYSISHNKSNNRMHPDAFDAMKVIVDLGYVDKKMLNTKAYQLYGIECQLRTLRNITISSKLSARRIMKDIKKNLNV